MRKIVFEKKQEAEEQIAQWRLRLMQERQAVAQAEEQVARWDAILTTCNELLDQHHAEERAPRLEET